MMRIEFGPRTAMQNLCGTGPSHEKIRSMAQLLAWITLDQQRNKQERKPAEVGSKNTVKSRPTVSTKKASHAGRIATICLLDKRFWKSTKAHDSRISQMLDIIDQDGGFSRAFRRRESALNLLDEIQKSLDRLSYVYRIIQYLLRCNATTSCREKSNVEYAKLFIQKTGNADRPTAKISKLGSCWEKYSAAAPYIYVYFRYLRFAMRKGPLTVNKTIKFLTMLTKEKRLHKNIAFTAYVVGQLPPKLRRTRAKDFKAFEAQAPKLRIFKICELEMVNSLDLNERQNDDGLPYRPKLKRATPRSQRLSRSTG